MNELLVLLLAMGISLFLTPIMTRFAARLGMMDRPGPRKVHSRPVPRVGGLGIVAGALAPLLIWAPLDPLMQSYIFGAVVLLVFGVRDDIRELGHYAKFAGQFLAVLPVVYYGGLYISSFPLVGEGVVPPAAAMAFTTVAMVGMINALNHSDGLDGLAGGESLVSLLAVAYLAWLAGGALALLIAAAAIGGLLGFLRYNAHPAYVFMGDGGSQFLGYTLGFLAVLLTQRVDPALSPAVVLLLLGLPIVDILAVLVQRAYQGMNWFRASKNHIHHRLLQLGYVPQQSVVMIYTVQALLVLSGLLLRHAHDGVIILLYCVISAVVFGLLALAERHAATRPPVAVGPSVSPPSAGAASPGGTIGEGAVRYVGVAIPVYLVAGSLVAPAVPVDLGIAAIVLVGLMVIAQASRIYRAAMLRGVIYGTVACVAFLVWNQPPSAIVWWSKIELVYLLLLGPAIAVAVRHAPYNEFRTTATDYLVLMLVIGLWILMHYQMNLFDTALLVVKAVLLLYGCELLITRMRHRWNALSMSATGALVVLGLRSLELL
jgi:UDP-GlcNAc:undecaprenyl-phosphate/decaprenyl-phosphate GlcNAc-1-phosphate transferase